MSRNSPKGDEKVLEQHKRGENETDESRKTKPSKESDTTGKHFKTIIQKIYDDLNAPPESLVLNKLSNSEFQVTCLPCSTKKSKNIDAGCKTKALSNLKAHLKTPSHQAKAATFIASKRQSHPESKDVVKAQADKASSEFNFQKVEEKFPGRFELLRLEKTKNSARCRTCNAVINLTPEGGSVIYKSGEPLWYSIPQYKDATGNKIIQGTIKSVNCREILVNSNSNMCIPCSDLLKEPSFIKRIQRSSKRKFCNTDKTFANKTNNRFLGTQECSKKLKMYRKMNNDQKLNILRLFKTGTRLKASKLKLSQRLGEQAKRGDVSAIMHSLNLANKKGL